MRDLSMDLFCSFTYFINPNLVTLHLRVFDYEDCAYIFILGLIEQSISILYKCIGFYKSFDSKMDLLFQLTKALSNGQDLILLGNIYSIVYDILMIINISDIRSNIYLLPFDIATIAFHYIRVNKIYSKIRIKAIGSKYKYFMHLFDLTSNILILIHMFVQYP